MYLRVVSIIEEFNEAYKGAFIHIFKRGETLLRFLHSTVHHTFQGRGELGDKFLMNVERFVLDNELERR